MIKALILCLLTTKYIFDIIINTIQINYLKQHIYDEYLDKKMIQDKIYKLFCYIKLYLIEYIVVFFLLLFNAYFYYFKIFDWMGPFFGCIIAGLFYFVLETVFNIFIANAVMKEKSPINILKREHKSNEEIIKNIFGQIGTEYAFSILQLFLFSVVLLFPGLVGIILFGFLYYCIVYFIPFIRSRYKKNYKDCIDFCNEEIITKINDICDKNNIKIGKILVCTKAQDEYGAYVSMDKQKNIVLEAGLVEHFSNEVIEAVIIHELGHIKNNHTFKAAVLECIVGTLVVITKAFLLSFLPIYTQFGFNSINAFLFIILDPIVVFPIYYFKSYLLNINNQKHEYDADMFVVSCNYSSELTRYLLKDKKSITNMLSHPIYGYLCFDHPSNYDRSKRIREYNDCLIDE